MTTAYRALLAFYMVNKAKLRERVESHILLIGYDGGHFGYYGKSVTKSHLEKWRAEGWLLEETNPEE